MIKTVSDTMGDCNYLDPSLMRRRVVTDLFNAKMLSYMISTLQRGSTEPTIDLVEKKGAWLQLCNHRLRVAGQVKHYKLYICFVTYYSWSYRSQTGPRDRINPRIYSLISPHLLRELRCAAFDHCAAFDWYPMIDQNLINTSSTPNDKSWCIPLCAPSHLTSPIR